MKKVFIALGILLVIAGIVIVAIFGGLDGFVELQNQFKQDLSAANERIDYVNDDPQTVKVITFNSDTYSLYVRKTDAAFFTVKYPTVPDGVSLTYNESLEHHSLDIHQTDGNKFGSFVWNPSFAKRFVIIEVPASANGIEIIANAKCGSISIVGIDCKTAACAVNTGSVQAEKCLMESLKITSTTGAVTVCGNNLRTVDISTDTGAISVSGVSVAELKAKTDTGAIKVTESVIANKADLTASTGSITYNSTATAVFLETDTGAINFSTNAAYIEARADTGAIRGTVNGKKSDYSISVSHDTGPCNLEPQHVDGPNTLKVENDTGAVNIEFSQN